MASRPGLRSVRIDSVHTAGLADVLDGWSLDGVPVVNLPTERLPAGVVRQLQERFRGRLTALDDGFW